MYTKPEVRELGTISAFTLGSVHHPGAVTKANNNVADLYSSLDTANPQNYGTPCTATVPGVGGLVTNSCNLP